MATVYGHINAQSNSNPAGVSNILRFVPKSYITTWGAFSVGTAPGDSMRITGNHVINGPLTPTTEGWFKLAFTPTMNEGMFESQGGRGGKSAKGTHSGFYHGRSTQMDELLSNEEEYILLERDLNCTGTVKYLQYGTECLGAWIESWKYSTRKAGASEVRGYDIVFNCNQAGIYTYEGTVTDYVA